MQKLSFTIERLYEPQDVKFHGDSFVSLIDDETGKVVMQGDWYHDKIDELIKGFFLGLEYQGIEYEKKTIRKNDTEGIIW